MSRSGCGHVELVVLSSIDELTNSSDGPFSCAEALTVIEKCLGLGARYGYDLLLDLARPWLIPVPLVKIIGGYGDRTFPDAEPSEFTECRLTAAGALALAADSGLLAPVPIGMLNGTLYCGGIVPSLQPLRAISALRRILEDNSLSDEQVLELVGLPYFASGCDVGGDVDGLYHGEHVMLNEISRIDIADDYEIKKPVDTTCRTSGDVASLPAVGSEVDLVIGSLPGRVSVGEVAVAIGRHSDRRPAPVGSSSALELPVAAITDQSRGAQVDIRIRLRRGSDPEDVKRQLLSLECFARRVDVSFDGSLCNILRSWVDRHRGEDIAVSLDRLERAISRPNGALRS